MPRFYDAILRTIMPKEVKPTPRVVGQISTNKAHQQQCISSTAHTLTCFSHAIDISRAPFRRPRDSIQYDAPIHVARSSLGSTSVAGSSSAAAAAWPASEELPPCEMLLSSPTASQHRHRGFSRPHAPRWPASPCSPPAPPRPLTTGMNTKMLDTRADDALLRDKASRAAHYHTQFNHEPYSIPHTNTIMSARWRWA